ncbi:MAG: MFS transporter [Dehalococcoidia bacterium]|nr:MFS transporter [Dehalococcoidia bacterium]
MPNITNSFGTDVQTVQWIIIFYVGSTTGLQISLGSAADTYGIKRFFIIGLIVYTIAVLLISVAPHLSLVMGLRVLQAVGNGLLVASAPALVTRAFPSNERGKALGLMSGIGLSGMLIGSLAGGVVVDAFGW